MGERDNITQDRTTGETDRDRFLKRRRFLKAAGGVSAIGFLAGCAGGDTETTTTQTTEQATTTEAETTTEEEEPTTTEEEEDEEPEEPSLEEKYPGLRILSPEPENAEAAERATYTNMITQAEEFYIRNHYPSPDIDEDEWTVSLTGLVDSEVELSMDELKRRFSTETIFHTMQCSGNGRNYFDPQVGGNQWTFGAVGNAEWTGTPISDILEEYGADTGDDMWLTVMGGEAPDGEDIFTRSIPMSKVMEDAILAFEMNGRPLPKEHGFPVRILVPGWYGNNNVKWVDRMHVMDRMVYPNDTWEPEGGRLYTHWQQYSYRIFGEGLEEPEFYETISEFGLYEQMESDDIAHPYLYDQPVKSMIGFPGESATVTPGVGGRIEVIGVVWAGDDAVETVEVSTDGGDTWNEAEFMRPDLGAYSWRLFRYIWEPESGDYTLYSRATDENGNVQPASISASDGEAANQARIMNDEYPWNQSGYGANAYDVHGVEVTVQ
ncbi:MAG: molybdopterin-dependent oxidoreductase [Halobacteriota archaeon]